MQALKQGVRVTLAMGDQPSAASVQGQDVLQGQLALPTGAAGGRAGRGCQGERHALPAAAAAGAAGKAALCLRCPPTQLPPAQPCRPSADPRERGGHYWGYITRIAPGLAALREGCPFPGGYDLVVGTSGAWAAAKQWSVAAGQHAGWCVATRGS